MRTNRRTSILQSPRHIWTVIHSPAFILANWVTELRPAVFTVTAGAVVYLKTLPIPGTPFSGQLTCRYTEIREPEYVGFTLESIATQAWVLYGSCMLVADAGGCRLTLTLSGFEAGRSDHIFVREVLAGAMQFVLFDASRRVASRLAAALRCSTTSSPDNFRTPTSIANSKRPATYPGDHPRTQEPRRCTTL